MNMDLLFLDNKQSSEKNQMNSQMVMLQMIKKSKMNMTEKTILFKMKVSLERDITFTYRDTQMKLLMVMPLMIKRSKMSTMVRMILFKMKDLPGRDIICTHKKIKNKRSIITLNP